MGIDIRDASMQHEERFQHWVRVLDRVRHRDSSQPRRRRLKVLTLLPFSDLTFVDRTATWLTN